MALNASVVFKVIEVMKFLLVLLLTIQQAVSIESACKTGNCSQITAMTTEDTTETPDVSTTPEYEDSGEQNTSTTVTASEVPPPENATQMTPNTTVSSNTTNATTISTTMIPTIPTPIFPTRNLEAVLCTCDLLVETCDIECCCDSDCTVEDRKAFSHCSDVFAPFPPEPRLCHRTQWLYTENTPFSSPLYQTGLMCLHTDNVPQRYWIQHPKVITTLKDFKHFESRAKTVPWPVPLPYTKPELTSGFPYKYGQIIWTLKKNNTIQPFNLPTNILSFNCEGRKNIQYLENWQSKCLQTLPESCKASYGSINASDFSNFYILSSPLEPLLNQTEPWLSIQVLLCSLLSLDSVEPKNCTEMTTAPSPSLSVAQRTCENAVLRARYILQHNGTEGITAVKVFIWLGPLPLRQLVSQKLEVVFEWLGSTSHPFRRSGRPGYLQSSPLLMGILSEDRSKVMPLSEDNGLGVLSAGSDGLCTNIRPIHFREDLLAQCSVAVSLANFTRTGCANLSQSIMQLFIANVSLINNLVVAAFGDSEWGTLTDWVPVIFKDIPSDGIWLPNNVFPEQEKIDNKTQPLVSDTDIGACGNVPTSLNIHILWAAVGSYSSPQSKVLGVQFSFATTEIIDAPLESNNKKFIKVTTSIKFTDLTPTPNARYAPPPKYEIRLPRDFFYPLFTTNGANKCVPLCSIFMLVLLLNVQFL